VACKRWSAPFGVAPGGVYLRGEGAGIAVDGLDFADTGTPGDRSACRDHPASRVL